MTPDVWQPAAWGAALGLGLYLLFHAMGKRDAARHLMQFELVLAGVLGAGLLGLLANAGPGPVFAQVSPPSALWTPAAFASAQPRKMPVDNRY